MEDRNKQTIDRPLIIRNKDIERSDVNSPQSVNGERYLSYEFNPFTHRRLTLPTK